MIPRQFGGAWMSPAGAQYHQPQTAVPSPHRSRKGVFKRPKKMECNELTACIDNFFFFSSTSDFIFPVRSETGVRKNTTDSSKTPLKSAAFTHKSTSAQSPNQQHRAPCMEGLSGQTGTHAAVVSGPVHHRLVMRRIPRQGKSGGV